MMSKLYDALIGAGASPEQARAAVGEVASLGERMRSIERKLDRVAAMLVVMAGAVLAILVRV